jgi:hypothetical protein
MNLRKLLIATATVMALSAPAFAQDHSAPGNLNAGEETQRDVNQQDRIENGLKDGQLSTGEAARLEHGEQHIDNAEAKAMSDGTMTPEEKERIQRMQNHESKEIVHDEHNNIHGNPNSASDQRMQHDVQRDANQEQRIHNGIENGSLANREAGHLEHGQARDDHAEWRGGRNGHMSAREQRHIQRNENRQSNRTWDKKHNRWNRHGHGHGEGENGGQHPNG